MISVHIVVISEAKLKGLAEGRYRFVYVAFDPVILTENSILLRFFQA